MMEENGSKIISDTMELDGIFAHFHCPKCGHTVRVEFHGQPDIETPKCYKCITSGKTYKINSEENNEQIPE